MILLVPDLSWNNPFARNEGRSSKTEVKLQFYLCRICPGATLSHEMEVDRQKLHEVKVKLRFYMCRTCPGATLSHEMRVDRQKLR